MDSAQTRAVATVRAASRSRDGFTVIELLTVIAIVGFGLMFATLVLVRTRTEIRLRRASALMARQRRA